MTSAAARHELYTSLREAIGEANADTLMTYLPAISGEELANRAEVAAMRSDLTSLRHEMQTEFIAVRNEMQTEFKAVRIEMRREIGDLRQEFTSLLLSQVADINKRLDRVFLAQVATVVALGAAIYAG